MKNRQFGLSYFSPKVEKRASPIDGRGLFAKQPIKMGEVVVVKGGYVLTRAQRDHIAKSSGQRKFRSPRTSLSVQEPAASEKAA